MFDFLLDCELFQDRSCSGSVNVVLEYRGISRKTKLLKLSQGKGSKGLNKVAIVIARKSE